MCTYLGGMLFLGYLNRDEIGEFIERMCNYGHEQSEFDALPN